MDLRGYGDSEKPASSADHAPYSKRAMAADARAVMHALGYSRFAVVGHDRGGRVAHRLALDHPDRRAARSPRYRPDPDDVRAHRPRLRDALFLVVFPDPAEPLPERMIGADPEAYLRRHLRGQSATPGIRKSG